MKEIQKIEKVNCFFPKLDAVIDKIAYPFKDQENYEVTFNLYQSIGEQGEDYTEFYDSMPSKEEMLIDLRDMLLKTRLELQEEFCPSAREENYLRILNKIAKKKSFEPVLGIRYLEVYK